MSSDYIDITYTDNPIQEDIQHCGVLPFCDSELFTRSISNHIKLTSGDDVKQVYELTISISDINHNFIPGDAIGILPQNNAEEVDLLMNLLGLQDQNYCLSILEGTTKKKAVVPEYIPKNSNVKYLFDQVLDIRSLPKKAFLKMLAQYTSNQSEKDELLKLSTPKEETYNNFIVNEGRSLLTTLLKFPTCKPPLARLLEHLPALKPRFYSISSSTSQTLSITYSVIEHEQEINDKSNDITLKGVCTSYLENLLESTPKNKRLRFYFRKPTNFLNFEPEFNYPLILIGPGTGVAPFKGFLEAQSQKKLENTNLLCNKIHLFFGCRYSQRDFLYKKELNDFLTEGTLSALYVAFSRETNNKIYVQDKIKEHGELICDLIFNENAYLRLCGDAKNLTKGVDEALKDIFIQHRGYDEGQSDDFLKEIKKSGRYSLDVWL